MEDTQKIQSMDKLIDCLDNAGFIITRLCSNRNILYLTIKSIDPERQLSAKHHHLRMVDAAKCLVGNGFSILKADSYYKPKYNRITFKVEYW